MGEAFQIRPDALTHIPAQVAANWARAGFPVFPCNPATKAPLTPHGFKDATADLQTVMAWWQAHPNALVGLATGEASGLFVIDLDVDKDTGEALGEASFAALGLSHLLGSVPTVATPSGGRHLYFRDCGLGNSSGKLGAAIDTRGNGGYVIAPGSVTPKGIYSLLTGPITADGLTSVPEAVLARLRGNTDRATAWQPPRIDTGHPDYSDTASPEAEAAEILAHINPDCGYGEWLDVLMGLHDRFNGSAAGLSLADEWSARGAKYQRGEVAAKWKGFTAGGGTGWATVCHIARQYGADLGAISRRHRGQAEVTFSAGLTRSEPVASNRPAPAPSAETSVPEFFVAASLDGREVPERLWHVLNLIPANTVSIMTGDGGTGKSLVALQLAISTALGRMWLGQETTAGRALFISAEDDRDELHRRVASLARAEGFALSDLDGLTLCSLAGEDALLSVPEGPGKTMKETALFQRVEAWIAQHRPTLTVLDTLADLFGGDEINRAQARQFIGQLRGLALKYEATILLLAHPSLSGMARGDGNSGSTAWNNSVRSRLYLRRVAGEDGAEGDPDARILEVMKSNYGRIGASLSLRYRDGAFVCEGNGTALDALAASAKADRVFARLLRECHANGRRVNHAGGNSYAPKVFAAHPNAEGVTSRALKRAMETALASGSARIETEGPPSRRVSYLVPGAAS